MEQNDLITIIILVIVAIAIGVVWNSLANREKKVCIQQICDYENKCDAYCGGMIKSGCPTCPECQTCPPPLNAPVEIDLQEESNPMQIQENPSMERIDDATIIEPIAMNYDDIFERPMYPSTMNTDLKSSCGSVDRTETRQQMLGAPFPTNYKSMML